MLQAAAGATARKWSREQFGSMLNAFAGAPPRTACRLATTSSCCWLTR
ncbi:hypothetical protein ACRAWD_00025 [Caulobacter segnis]